MKRVAFVGILLAGLLMACQQLGLVTPQTFDQKLAVGYSSVTAVRQTALTLLKAKKISADDAENVQKQADVVREGLDVARKLKASNALSAEDKLSAALSALSVVQQYLTKRGA